MDKSRLKTLIDNYEQIIHFRNHRTNVATFFKVVEANLGKMSYCNSCPSSIRKATADFERITFNSLYKEFPQFIYKPNKELLSKTRFTNGMYDTLVTSSFESFTSLLDSFVVDFKSKRYNMSPEEFKLIQDELIMFNTNRNRYFDLPLYQDVLVYLNEVEVVELMQDEPMQDVQELRSFTERVEDVEVIPIEPETISEDYLKTEGKYKDRKVNLIEAFALRQEGVSNKDIAEKYGVSKQNISNLFKKHLNNYKG